MPSTIEDVFIMIARGEALVRRSVTPDILVRGLVERTVERLKDRAKRIGKSMQSELKAVLQDAAGRSLSEVLDEVRKFRKKLGRCFDDCTNLIREDRRR